VTLDPDFGQVVKGDGYQVFLTEYGANQGLYVVDRRPNGFEVRSNAGAGAAGSFGYRVVARRLDDVGTRMEKVDVPDVAGAREHGRKLIEQAQPAPGNVR
jgi:hypothetical protein